MKTVINIKIDKGIKEKAQKVAKDLGIPLGTVIKNYLNDFIEEERVVFANHPTPNTQTRKRLNAALKDVREGKNLSPILNNAQAAIDYLKK